MHSYSLAIDRRSGFGAMRWLAAICVLVLPAAVSLAAPASIALPGNRAFPESVSSTKDGTIYAGSIVAGGVVRVGKQGAAELWIKPGAFGSASILGVLADERTHTLWVCSNNYSSYGVEVPGALPGSALLGFDLASGEGKIRLPLPSNPSSCNDIAIAPDGAICITNSETPEILRLAPGAKQLEIWFTEPSLKPAPAGSGLDGIAFGSDGHAYISHYDAGDLYRIEVANNKAGKLTKLRPSRALVLPDAIRLLHGNSFLLVEGGGRLNTMTIDGDSASILTLKEGLDTPTSVTTVGDTAWVSEGQLEHLLEPAKARLPFQLFSVPIPK